MMCMTDVKRKANTIDLIRVILDKHKISALYTAHAFCVAVYLCPEDHESDRFTRRRTVQ